MLLTGIGHFQERLPVGIMFIGKYWHEPTVLQVAHALKQIG
jgi:Asp-tRNA(Asn)/Glu-tRNA(Gln) amidotransferase A subunit family amidase